MWLAFTGRKGHTWSGDTLHRYLRTPQINKQMHWHMHISLYRNSTHLFLPYNRISNYCLYTKCQKATTKYKRNISIWRPRSVTIFIINAVYTQCVLRVLDTGKVRPARANSQLNQQRHRGPTQTSSHALLFRTAESAGETVAGSCLFGWPDGRDSRCHWIWFVFVSWKPQNSVSYLIKWGNFFFNVIVSF